MSTKRVLPRPVAERFFVSMSSPLFADGSRSLERFFSGWLLRSLGSFSSSDNVRRLLKLGKRFDSWQPWFYPRLVAGIDRSNATEISGITHGPSRQVCRYRITLILCLRRCFPAFSAGFLCATSSLASPLVQLDGLPSNAVHSRRKLDSSKPA